MKAVVWKITTLVYSKSKKRLAEVKGMMKKDKTLKAAVAGALLLAVTAAGITMYRAGDGEQQEKESEEQQLAEDITQRGMSEGQKDAMDSEPETADVTTDDAQAKNTQALEGEDTSSAEDSSQETAETSPASQSTQEEQMQPQEEAPQTEDTSASVQPEMNFTEDSSMLWPVSGQVVIDYSMDATTYFPTLEQYKYNSALVMSSAVGDPVQATANGQIVSVLENEETGTTLTMDLGNGYQAVYGQLKDVAVTEGQVVEAGTVLGNVNDPTKYYVTEGPNLYFAMTKDGTPVDPMIYIETVTE